MNSLRKSIQITPRFSSIIRQMSDVKPGSANAGAIRAAGGAFAKLEIAHEEEYFYHERLDQLHKLKEGIHKKEIGEADFREQAIKDHEAAIKRHKSELEALRNKK